MTLGHLTNYLYEGPSANWARVVQFIKAESDVVINYWTSSLWAVQVFVHPQSVADRYQI